MTWVSNQIIQWSMFILPWLSLFFMKSKDVKRYMPSGLLSIVLTTIVHDVGVTLGFWVVHETTFPFNEMMPYFYGTMPLITIWVLKFTFGNYWKYMMTNIILDTGFVYLLLDYFYPVTGVYGLVGITPLKTLPISLLLAVIIYPYQIWQDKLPDHSQRTSFPGRLKPAAAKALPEEDNNLDKEES